MLTGLLLSVWETGSPSVVQNGLTESCLCLLIAGIRGHMPPCPASASFLTHPGTICPELAPPTVSQAQSLIKKMPCRPVSRLSDGGLFSIEIPLPR